MTVIHGDITKIYEIEKDAYTQQIDTGAYIDAYSFATTVIALSTGYYEITPTTFPRSGSLLISINMSTNSVSGIMQRIYIIKYPEVRVLGDFYFRYDSTKQFSLGGVDATLALGEYIRVYLENNDAGNRFFEGTIWWLNPPAS